MDQSRSAAREAVAAVMSDDHNAENAQAALRAIIAWVVETSGTEGVADLASELASRLADMVKETAQDLGLLAADVLDILFLDLTEVISLQPGFGHLSERPTHHHEDHEESP